MHSSEEDALRAEPRSRDLNRARRAHQQASAAPSLTAAIQLCNKDLRHSHRDTLIKRATFLGRTIDFNIFAAGRLAQQRSMWPGTAHHPTFVPRRRPANRQCRRSHGMFSSATATARLRPRSILRSATSAQACSFNAALQATILQHASASDSDWETDDASPMSATDATNDVDSYEDDATIAR